LTHSLSCTFPDGEQSGLVAAPTTYQFPIDHIPYESRTIKATVKFPQGDDVLGKTQWDVLLEHHNRGEVQLDNDGKLLSEIITLMSIATGESVLRLYTAGGPRFSGSNLSDGVVECVNGGHAVVLNYSSDPLATNWNYQYNECVLEGFTVSGIVTGSSTRSSSGQAFELLEIHFDSGEFVELSGTATTNVRNGDGSDPETIAVLNKSASGWLVHNRPDSIETRSHNFFSSCTLQESSGHEDSMTVKDTRGRTFDVAGLEARFKTRDSLFGGDTTVVRVFANRKNEGTIHLTSDNGASLSVGLTSGQYPAIHIDQQIDGQHSFRVIPWSPVFTFDCFYFGDP